MIYGIILRNFEVRLRPDDLILERRNVLCRYRFAEPDLGYECRYFEKHQVSRKQSLGRSLQELLEKADVKRLDGFNASTHQKQSRSPDRRVGVTDIAVFLSVPFLVLCSGIFLLLLFSFCSKIAHRSTSRERIAVLRGSIPAVGVDEYQSDLADLDVENPATRRQFRAALIRTAIAAYSQSPVKDRASDRARTIRGEAGGRRRTDFGRRRN